MEMTPEQAARLSKEGQLAEIETLKVTLKGLPQYTQPELESKKLDNAIQRLQKQIIDLHKEGEAAYYEEDWPLVLQIKSKIPESETKLKALLQRKQKAASEEPSCQSQGIVKRLSNSEA